MAKAPKPIPRQGSPKAEEIYTAVGVALSYWEASEDMLMGLFKLLVFDMEPTAFDAYVSSSRGRRNDLLKSVMGRYKHKFKDGEIEQIDGVIKALSRLAEARNEIAHGHCTEAQGSAGEAALMSGNYLVPSFHAEKWLERSTAFRYAHTAETIYKFVADVREQRGIVMDVWGQLTDRHNARFKLGNETVFTIQTAKRVATGEIEPQAVLKHLALVDPGLLQLLTALPKE